MSTHCSIPYTRSVIAADGKVMQLNSFRPTVIQAIIQVSAVTADEFNPGCYAACLGFSLPPGSYGTMALRQLMHFLPHGRADKPSPTSPL